MRAPESSPSPPRFQDRLSRLPLFDGDLFLSMQALNIDIVDLFLREQEEYLRQRYIESEGTPTQEAIFVSAFSQLWVFGIYELLRTWRQRCKEVEAFAERYNATPLPERANFLKAQRNKVKDLNKH